MKRFRFTLEAVRTVRQRQEQDAMDQFARTLLARQQAVERLEAVQQRLTAGFHELRHLLSSGCEAATAAQMQAYHRALEKQRDECLAAVGLAERRVNAAFNVMLMARRQREIVDKGREKQQASYQREIAREEQKFQDDLAGRRTSSILAWNATGTLP